MRGGPKHSAPVRSQPEEEAPFVALHGGPVAHPAIASEVGAPGQMTVVFELRQRHALPCHIRGLFRQLADPFASPSELPGGPRFGRRDGGVVQDVPDPAPPLRLQFLLHLALRAGEQDFEYLVGAFGVQRRQHHLPEQSLRVPERLLDDAFQLLHLRGGEMPGDVSRVAHRNRA